MGYWPVLALGAGAVGMALLAGLQRLDRRRVALLIWTALPVLLLVALAMRNNKPLNARYVSVVLPWLLLLAGVGLARLPRLAGLLVTAVLAGMTLWSLGGYYGDEKYEKADLRQAVALVNQAQPPSRVVLVPVVTSVYRYYDGDAHVLLNSYGQAPLTDREAAQKFVAESLGGHDYCRVVLAREWYLDPQGYLLQALSRVGHLRLEDRVPGVSIYTWERKRAPSLGSDMGNESGLGL